MMATYITFIGSLVYFLAFICLFIIERLKLSAERKSILNNLGNKHMETQLSQLDISSEDIAKSKQDAGTNSLTDNSTSEPNETTIGKPRFKRNLTIEIPQTPKTKDLKNLQEEDKFIVNYFKENCFPLALKFSNKRSFKRTSILTI